MIMNSILCAKNINKSFGEKTVLNELDLTLFENDFVTLIGGSGCGKTTLLNIIGLLDNNFSGQLEFNGILIDKKMLNRKKAKNQIGYVFQSFYLLDYLNVEENILLPFRYTNETPDQEYLSQLFEKLSIEKILTQKANVLSGGEKQRVAIARALSRKPKLLICDEPTGNLDSANRDNVLNLLKLINDDYKTTILIVTHDEKIAASGKRKLLLKNGKIYE